MEQRLERPLEVSVENAGIGPEELRQRYIAAFREYEEAQNAVWEYEIGLPVLKALKDRASRASMVRYSAAEALLSSIREEATRG